MKKLRMYGIVFVLAIVVLSIVRVAVTNMISTDGIDLGKIQNQVAEYKKQNAILQAEILDLSSLNHIASKAGELGFVSSKKEMVLTSPPPLALNQ